MIPVVRRVRSAKPLRPTKITRYLDYFLHPHYDVRDRQIMILDRDTTAEQAAQHYSHLIKDKTVIITGVSPGGLGAEVARVLAKHSCLVVLAGRSVSKSAHT